MGKAAGFGGAERADDNVNVRAPGAVFSYGDFSDAERDRAGGRGAEQRGAEVGGHGVEQSVCGWLRCGKERIREDAAAQRRSICGRMHQVGAMRGAVRHFGAGWCDKRCGGLSKWQNVLSIRGAEPAKSGLAHRLMHVKMQTRIFD